VLVRGRAAMSPYQRHIVIFLRIGVLPEWVIGRIAPNLKDVARE